MKKIFNVIFILIVFALLFSACGDTKSQTMSCSLSVRCDTILDNPDKLTEAKRDIIPKDGVILSVNNVSFGEGESLLEILQNELKKKKIHIDFEKTTSVGSAYVKGIANIYSGDCGELSGWMIRVNGEDLTVGCGDYFPEDGDTAEWLYTCDMGNDL